MYVAKPPSMQELWAKTAPDKYMTIYGSIGHLSNAEYLHWDKLRHLDPPNGLTHEEWWLGLKMARGPILRQLPLMSIDNQRFTFALPDAVLRLLHFVDQRSSGEIAMPEVVTADEQARQHYLVNSLMEEAIRSSQLEGATTSRRVAKELLQSGRPPTNRSERMIVNNYHASQYMRDSLGERLAPENILAMHRILTEGTLDNPDAAGRLQTADDERVAVFDRASGELIHQPPPAEQLAERLQGMCDFANESEDGSSFIHPVIRSTLLHFWLAYDHPFEDGNGRTARLLFYWSMRKHGYWLTEYLSISRILRQAPTKYARSFLLTETDDLDATYFIIYQLEVMRRAMDELHVYLKRKVNEVRKVEQALRGAEDLNHRQLALLSDAIRRPGKGYTPRSHAATHGVTEETARTDLLQLWRRDLLSRRKAGRRFIFEAPSNLSELVTAPASS